MSKLLEVNNLNVSFRTLLSKKHVLKNISLDVYKNEVLAIVGESGSGKSVTIKSIMGIAGTNATSKGEIKFIAKDSDCGERPKGESIQIKEEEEKEDPNKYLDILKLSRSQAQHLRGSEISMIFQDPMTSLNPVFTVGNQIAEVIREHQGKNSKQAMEEAGNLLDLVRVPGGRKILKSYPHQLSGGMRQRVVIAMALACKPKLLIADEPTTALDVTIQAQILGLIKELQKELCMGVIFVTHDMGVVAEIADRVAVMYKGEIVETNSVKEVFTAPQHPYTQALLKSAPKLGSMAGRDLPHSFPVLNMEESLKSTSDDPILEIAGNKVDYGQKPLLTVNDLSVTFNIAKNFFGRPQKQIHAVRNISFDLFQGETVGIVGESGSGKSTIGNAILGLLPLNACGDISYDNIDLLRERNDHRDRIYQDISFVFQDPMASLNPRVTIGRSIEEPLKIHTNLSPSERFKKVQTLLKKVGIDPSLFNHYPHEFSGGMLQRVNIARALSTDPKIIIADESVSALDVSVQATVLNLMMELQKELKVSFIFISHDMAVIERVCHRVLVMTKGQLVEVGTRKDIFEDTRHCYTKKLLNAIPIMDFNSPKKTFELLTDDISDPIYPVGVKPPQVSMVNVSNSHMYAKAQ